MRHNPLSKRFQNYDDTKWVVDTVPDPALTSALRQKLTKKTEDFRRRTDFASAFFANLSWIQSFAEAFKRSFEDSHKEEIKKDKQIQCRFSEYFLLFKIYAVMYFLPGYATIYDDTEMLRYEGPYFLMYLVQGSKFLPKVDF